MGLFTASQASKRLNAMALSKVDFSKFAPAFPEGTEMPSLTPDRVGKYKLQQFLRQSFGHGYAQNKTAKMMVDHFDSHTAAYNMLNQRSGM